MEEKGPRQLNGGETGWTICKVCLVERPWGAAGGGRQILITRSRGALPRLMPLPCVLPCHLRRLFLPMPPPPRQPSATCTIIRSTNLYSLVFLLLLLSQPSHRHLCHVPHYSHHYHRFQIKTSTTSSLFVPLTFYMFTFMLLILP